jgi:hypothetical protein
MSIATRGDQFPPRFLAWPHEKLARLGSVFDGSWLDAVRTMTDAELGNVAVLRCGKPRESRRIGHAFNDSNSRTVSVSGMTANIC